MFVDRVADAPPADPDTDVVVLDTSWTPGPLDRTDLRPVRPVVEQVLARENLVDGSLAALDDWAARARIADAFVADGVTWWYRSRMIVRWDVHELALWQHVLAELDGGSSGRWAGIEVPSHRQHLRSAAQATGLVLEGDPTPVSRAEGLPATRFTRAAIRGLQRRLKRLMPRTTGEREERRRRAALDARIDVLRRRPGGVLAVAAAGFFQVLEIAGEQRFADPHLALVLDRLAREGVPVTTVALTLNHAIDNDWQLIEADERLIPESVIRARWGRPIDRGIDSGAVRRRMQAAQAIDLRIAGADLGPAVHQLVFEMTGAWLAGQRRWRRWAGHLLADLRPRVLLVDHEGVRTLWLAAARQLGIPIVAVQHGVIYDNNPEYCHAPHPADVRPDVTCVFGEFERDVLVRQGGYDPGRVVVTGSSRSDPDSGSLPGSPTERDDVRRELGVRPGDRLLLVSVAHNPVFGDLYSMTMLGRILGGPLPNIHVAIKLHPQDRAESRHEELLVGLARAGGYAPPPVTIVRTGDLYRLLRAADAHLGEHSTVLTDAVVAATPNMIAMGGAYSDVLGWAANGVATPVRGPADVVAFMAAPIRPTAAERDRFLASHFRSGDATGRIVDVIRGFMPAAASVER